MKPKIRITDSRFVYRDSAHTNIRETFKRVRREMKRAEPKKSVVVIAITPPKKTTA